MLSMEPLTSNIHYLEGFIEFQGHTIRAPKTRGDYVRLCRRFLDSDTFYNFFRASFDKNHYEQLGSDIKRLVDSYHSYPSGTP